MSTYPDGIVHQPPYNSIGMNNMNDIDADDKSNIRSEDVLGKKWIKTIVACLSNPK
jgi:hypothetical protein